MTAPKLRVVIGADPSALLAEAADGFLQRAAMDGPFPSPPYLLALRQGGLRDDLFRLAASRGVPGWFDPPVCVFHELPQWLGATHRRPLGDFERAALIEHLLRRAGGDVFRGREGAFLPAVDRLFGELASEGVSPDRFRAAQESRTDREAYERERDEALASVYAAYAGTLAAGGRRDGRDSLADTAAALERSPGELAERLGGRREIRIVGLADLRGGWQLLLRALFASPALDRVVLYGLAPLALPNDLIATRETEAAAPIEPGAGPVASASLRGVEILGERSEDAELESVAARVRRLVERGADPARIAVIARDGRPYLDLAVRALERGGVPATARLRVSVGEIPVVRAVLALLEAAAGGWTRRELVELGSQPCFASEVDARIINYLGYRERITELAAWRAALDRLLEEARAAEAALDDKERRPRSLPAAWVERARERFSAFTATAAAIEAARPLGAWLAWLADWLERDPWRIAERIGRVPEDRWDVLRLDLLGWRHLRTVVDEWRMAEEAWPGGAEPLPPDAFVTRLRAMLDGDVALHTETRRGVQVLEALAASYRSFEHVFLVGMNAGVFPRRPPSSLLLGELDREALRAAGLPLEVTAEWERRERDLFESLIAGAVGSLTVSYVAHDELGGAANPSSFVEALGERLAPETRPAPAPPVCRTPMLAAHAERVARIERERATGRLSPWNGAITTPDLSAWLGAEFGDAHVWSPTRLEAYAKCPWSHFSERLLRLASPDDPDEDMDPRVRGSVLHDALRRFYDAARKRLGGPVTVMPDDRPWAVPLLHEALAAALAGAGTTLWLGHPALRDVKYAELARLLERYLDFEIEENRKSLDGRTTAGRTVRTAVDAHELAFEGAVLERGSVTVRFRGIVDRVEVGVDARAPGSWVAAVDYKTSKWSAPAGGSKGGWADGVVLQVPLYAHALAGLRPGATVARVEYRAIKHAERLHHLSLVRVKASGPEEDAEAVGRMEQALAAVAGHVQRVRGGEFPARPAPSCRCPPFCHAWDICRVAGGPRTGRDP